MKLRRAERTATAGRVRVTVRPIAFGFSASGGRGTQPAGQLRDGMAMAHCRQWQRYFDVAIAGFVQRRGASCPSSDSGVVTMRGSYIHGPHELWSRHEPGKP